MKPTKPTIRQIQALRSIYDFDLKNGHPPSLGNLRHLLSVSSDQAVLELLKRLERRGLIQRTPGQARAISLTQEGRLVIGAPISQRQTSVSAITRPDSMELSAQQVRIVERLTEIEPRLAKIYLGGLRVLLDEGNPERLVQSAHSIRECTAHLSNAGKELLTESEKQEAKKTKANNARQLEKLFDPLGGVRSFDQTLYDHWNKEFHQFFIEVSHHGSSPTADEYREQLTRYEEFLNSYVLPLQTEVYERVDNTLAGEPTSTDPLELRLLLSRNVESYRYFYRKAGSRWLGYMKANKLLGPDWEAADYLCRIAPHVPEEVMATIEAMPDSSSNWRVRSTLIEAANKMPPVIGARMVKKIEREQWLGKHEFSWLSSGLNDLLQLLIAQRLHPDALILTEELLKNRSIGEARAPKHTDDYECGETLKRLSAVPDDALRPYVELLVRLLGERILSERPERKKDGSMMWRPAIEPSEQNWDHGDCNDLLVTGLRDALERYSAHITGAGKHLPTVLGEVLHFTQPYAIFKRMRLHLYRLNLTEAVPEVERAVLDEFNDIEVWHEYATLLATVFSTLSGKTRKRWFDLLDLGPAGEKDESYVQRWQVQRLSIVRAALSPDEIARYQHLLPKTLQIEHPDFLATHSETWVGPTSPKTEEDLTKMSVLDVIEHLATWTPVKDWCSPSREGLGRVFSAAVARNGEAYSKEAPRFLDPRLRPVYLYHLLQGLREGLKNGASLGWPAILCLATTIAGTERKGGLTSFAIETDDDQFEPRWDAVYQEIGSLLESGFQNQARGIPFELRDQTWELIQFICEHPDPSPEYEEQYGGDNMDPITLSLNTVRGRAFHSLFTYVFWCDRHLKGEGHRSRIPDEAKRILEAHLDKNRDPSLTVRAVYGRYLPWLFTYDPVWTSSLLNRIFPVDEPMLRYAAWEMYLTNTIFTQVYEGLRAQYELAIADLGKVKQARSFHSDPIKRLAEHMMIAYACRIGRKPDDLWIRFFRAANSEQRAMAVSFGGRAYVSREEVESDETFPETNRLQEFWEWRLKESKDTEELRAFGWWITAKKFNPHWMLEKLVETLEKTNGGLDGGFLALAALAKLSSSCPLLCSRALLFIVKSRLVDRWTLGYGDDIERVLANVVSSADLEAKSIAQKIVDHLTKLGFERYRSIPSKHHVAPPKNPGET